MGMKALWIAFGAATFYIVGLFTVPAVIVVLENAGVAEIGADTATDPTRLAALLMGALGGALGLRHAQRVEARRET